MLEGAKCVLMALDVLSDLRDQFALFFVDPFVGNGFLGAHPISGIEPQQVSNELLHMGICQVLEARPQENVLRLSIVSILCFVIVMVLLIDY